MMPLRTLGLSLLALALLTMPAGRAMAPLEAKWKQSIETDLSKGDPAGRVCTKAKIQASLSDDVAFKTWAYAISRRTCLPGASDGKASRSQPPANTPAQPLTRATAPSTYTSGCPLL